MNNRKVCKQEKFESFYFHWSPLSKNGRSLFCSTISKAVSANRKKIVAGMTATTILITETMILAKIHN